MVHKNNEIKRLILCCNNMILFYIKMSQKTNNSKKVMKCANQARNNPRTILLDDLCR